MVKPEKARWIKAQWIADQFEKSDHLADKNVAEVLRDLAAQVEALQADADRYAYAKQNPSIMYERWEPIPLSPNEIDSAIDCAMKKD